MASTYTTNKNLERPGNGDYVDTWNIPVNGDMTIIDAALGGVLNLNATAGNAVLSTSDYQNLIINVTGAMSASVVYTIPAGIGGQWIIRNATTDSVGGPWAVTFASGGGGATVTVLRGRNITIWSDGTNIYPGEPNIPSIGTVTSVDVSGGTSGITSSGGPIISSGTITLAMYGINSQALSTPALPTLTPSPSGGVLAATDYYIKIVAVDSLGGYTLPSTENVTTTSTPTSSVGISWGAVAGAASYQIWFATISGGQTSYFTSSTNSYTLTTTAGATAGTLPTTNSTGYVTMAGNKVSMTGTGSAILPSGSAAQRPSSATAGMVRYNNVSNQFEWYNGTQWSALGGASGGGDDQIFYLNGQTITTSYAIPSGQNAMSTGPLTINSGIVVSVPAGSKWCIL